MTLKKLSIEGFKSISHASLEIKNINVLIGANGAGKSNFVEIFRFLDQMLKNNLQGYVEHSGGPRSFFFNGPEVTPEIKMQFVLNRSTLDIALAMTADERMLLKDLNAVGIGNSKESRNPLQQTEDMPFLFELSGSAAKAARADILEFRLYHFHNTSIYAGMRLSESVDHYKYLEPDASNVAPFLLNLKKNKPEYYKKIVDVIQIVAPFFKDFDLTPEKKGPATVVKLNWNQKGSEYPFAPYQLSDGTLRFICLATALLQPELPSCLVIDEPELGLHPYAIEVLAGLIKIASRRDNASIIITTQSPMLLACFEPEDVIVVDRQEGASTFSRLKQADLSSWLENYSLGEIWYKNLISGGPVDEQ